MIRYLKILFLMLLSVTISSCKFALEYPDPGVEPIDPTKVDFSVDVTISSTSYSEFLLYKSESKSAQGGEYYIRTIAELYDNSDMTTPVSTTYYYTSYSEIDNFQLSHTGSLSAKDYTLAIWCDIVEETDGSDNYFYTGGKLSYITHLEPYEGSTEIKSTFSGVVDLELSTYQGSWFGSHSCSVALERPQAMYEIISTDLEAFRSEQGASANFDDYKVKVTYEGYMPYGYNVLTDKPNEAKSGVSYECKMEILSDDEVRLAFDQVFVNHAESTVTISFSVENEIGDVVAGVSSKEVTLNRNVKSVITGEFLTSDYEPGININPEFDGEFNVTIGD